MVYSCGCCVDAYQCICSLHSLMLAYVETVTLTQYSYTHTDFLTESHRSLSKRVRSHRSLTDGSHVFVSSLANRHGGVHFCAHYLSLRGSNFLVYLDARINSRVSNHD